MIFPIALYFIPLDWLNSQHSICLFKNLFGRECYGCGITRAVLSAIQFDFVNAWHYNRLVVVVLPLLIYIWANMLWHIYLKIKN
ncbi:MAG: DUF2752 domain-containing protein [Prevotellaceae bacterium]|nr:DUF2752 domain-containing protein [Prevotellaceae bacterium]